MADDKTTQTTPSAAGGNAPSSASPPPSQSTPPPAEDWQSRYAALEREYGEAKTRLEKYKGYGEPDQIGQVYQSLRQINDDFKAGKLTYAQAQQAKQELKDEYEGWDDLDPRQQAAKMRDLLRQDLGGLSKGEFDKFREEMKQYQVNLGTQQQLLFRIIQLKTEHPELNIDELLQAATEASAFGPQQILELQAKAQLNPKEQEAAFQKRLAEERTKWQQEQDAKKVPLATRRMPRLAEAHKNDPIARRQERIGNVIRRAAELQDRKVS